MTENETTNVLPVKHTTYVLQRLQEQRRKGMFCDATLIVEGEKFRVHKSFLAANSDYFLSLFTSAEEQHNFVLAGVPLLGFRVLMDFVYTSTFVLNLSNVHEVYKAATVLDFQHVKVACEKVYLKINHIGKVNSNNHLEFPPRRDSFRPLHEGHDRVGFNKRNTTSPNSIPAKHPDNDVNRRIPGCGVGGSEVYNKSPENFHCLPSMAHSPIPRDQLRDAQFMKQKLKRKVKSEPNDGDFAESSRSPKRANNFYLQGMEQFETNGRFSSPVSFEGDHSSSPTNGDGNACKSSIPSPTNEINHAVRFRASGNSPATRSDASGSEEGESSDHRRIPALHSSDERQAASVWKSEVGENATPGVTKVHRNRRKVAKTTRISVDSDVDVN